MVTDKNKEQFEKWYFNDYLKLDTPPKMPKAFMILFYKERFERQIGVYLAYYDSLECIITTTKNNVLEWWFYEIVDYYDCVDSYKSRNEAYQEAFKQADKLRNDKL